MLVIEFVEFFRQYNISKLFISTTQRNVIL